MANYRTSSQYNSWVFTSFEEISKIREKKTKRVAKKLNEVCEKHNKDEAEATNSNPSANYIVFDKTKIGKFAFLTPADELK